ncbi:MAG TPA: ethylbenzene dehydrogenase-related protein [Symbiobacteriaceae bacterium]|jgi:hypothetical protein|nr:ethylbenzene dehydrogenase-related protein [Symbiobacteriaceae bacterium]
MMQILSRLTRRQKTGVGIGLLLLLSIGLAVYQSGVRKPVANPTVIVRQAKTALPADPWDAAWKKVSAVTMPLAQVSTPTAPVRNVTVKALTDGTQLAIRLEWPDPSKDVLTLRPQDFGDAAAMQLSDQIYNACMGQLDGMVHIWQWKADWQEGSRDMKTAFPNMLVDGFTGPDGQPLLTEDLYARPALVAGNARAAATKEQAVEHLVAGGAGTLTAAGPHSLVAKGGYEKDRWAVVFVRPLQGAPGDVTLAAGQPLQAAFAVWDGQLMQRDGMKYVTQWAVLQLEAK